MEARTKFGLTLTAILDMCLLQAQRWPARKKWTHKYLQKAFKGQTVVAGSYAMSFEDYLAYMDGSADDMPLYLFDCKFADKAPQLAADYKVTDSTYCSGIVQCLCNTACSP